MHTERHPNLKIKPLRCTIRSWRPGMVKDARRKSENVRWCVKWRASHFTFQGQMQNSCERRTTSSLSRLWTSPKNPFLNGRVHSIWEKTERHLWCHHHHHHLDNSPGSALWHRQIFGKPKKASVLAGRSKQKVQVNFITNSGFRFPGFWGSPHTFWLSSIKNNKKL